MNEPLLSILVPTRERASKLPFTLRTVLGQSSEDFEVLVSDNASRDATAEVVRGFSDPRLRYVNTGKRLSMCDSYEFAVNNSRGRFLMIIGDDDALLPDAVASLKALIREQPARLYCWESLIYQWPTDSLPAVLQHLAAEGPTERVDLGPLTRFAFRWGGLRYIRLPLLYHSVVERGVLETIRQKTGRIFHSTQPDVFLAFAMPTICGEAVRIGRAMTIYGVSERPVPSPAIARHEGAFAEKTHRFLSEFPGYRFHESLLPEVPGWVNMIPDAMLVARDLFPDYYRDRPFDYDAMWAFLWRYWRFESVGAILARRDAIRRRHPFHPTRFLGFVAAHALSEARMKARRRLGVGPSWYRERPVPDNIEEFASSVGRLRGDGPAR